MSTTAHFEELPGGFTVIAPNIVPFTRDGFYISYNDYDISLHGCDTTCLATSDMRWFFVLNGDHRDGYAPLVEQGFQACFNYFLEHIDQIGKYSHKPEHRQQVKLPIGIRDNHWVYYVS